MLINGWSSSGGDAFPDYFRKAGFDPDIDVPENCTQLSKGVDNQLEKAIEEVMRLHKLNPPVNPEQPPCEKR